MKKKFFAQILSLTLALGMAALPTAVVESNTVNEDTEIDDNGLTEGDWADMYDIKK